jgi:hypothetical protein
VFVQGWFLILAPFDTAIRYNELGYECAFAIMPHTKKIVEKHFGADAFVVPPYVAPYFFKQPQGFSDGNRKKRVLLFPKAGYRDAGYHDLEIATKLLRRKCLELDGWEVLEVEGRTHREVATLMGESAFMVNVNSVETFNATVPEAMAAGCIPVCYEAFGGQDYLIDRHNAFVFQNNHVYPLLDQLFELMQDYESRSLELAEIRTNGLATARSYSREATEQALLTAFQRLGIT